MDQHFEGAIRKTWTRLWFDVKRFNKSDKKRDNAKLANRNNL